MFSRRCDFSSYRGHPRGCSILERRKVERIVVAPLALSTPTGRLYIRFYCISYSTYERGNRSNWREERLEASGPQGNQEWRDTWLTQFRIWFREQATIFCAFSSEKQAARVQSTARLSLRAGTLHWKTTECTSVVNCFHVRGEYSYVVTRCLSRFALQRARYCQRRVCCPSKLHVEIYAMYSFVYQSTNKICVR